MHKNRNKKIYVFLPVKNIEKLLQYNISNIDSPVKLKKLVICKIIFISTLSFKLQQKLESNQMQGKNLEIRCVVEKQCLYFVV